MSDIQLYGTLGCHLCEDAEVWLQHFFPMLQYDKVDIASDEHLVTLYGLHIPVLQIGDGVMDWPFDPSQAQSLLNQVSSPQPAKQQMPPKARRVFILGAEK